MFFAPQLTYILTWQDLYLGPLYILLILFFVAKWRKHLYRDSPLKKYIFPALICRMAGAIFLSLIFNFYYGYGDTFSYYTGAYEIWDAFTHSPKIALEIIMNHPSAYSADALEYAQHMGYPGFAASHYTMMKIAGVTGLISFGSYLPIALIFSLLSFFGTWMIFLVFNETYPHLRKYIAITTLFIPTIIVWTNGILKEPICMFALGLCFYAVNDLFKGRHVVRNIFLFALSAVILFNIKAYLLFIFLVGFIFWLYKTMIRHVSSAFLRVTLKSLIYLAMIGFIIYFFVRENNFVQNAFTSYLKKAENLQSMMISINRDYSAGSGYTLPTNDVSSTGIFQSFLLSLNVSLFRPYLWECNNPLMLLSFVESFAATLFIIYLLFKVGPVNIYKNFKHPLLIFSLIFSLLLATLVGFISFNFGTLIRYKVPFEPFFYTMLAVIAYNKLIIKTKEIKLEL